MSLVDAFLVGKEGKAKHEFLNSVNNFFNASKNDSDAAADKLWSRDSW